jgi:hypothetical protein
MAIPESIVNYVAGSLMKAWFPKNHVNQEWLDSEDGRNWTEIALMDAEVAINSYKEYLDKKYEY